MTANVQLIDPEQGLMSFLDLCVFRLTGPYVWMTSDHDTPACRISVVRACIDDPRPDDPDAVREVASLTFGDATGDDTEPDVDTVHEGNLNEVDRELRDGTGRQLAADGRTLLGWGSAWLSTLDGLRVLMSPFVFEDHATVRRGLCMRASIDGRRLVVAASIDDAQFDQVFPVVLEAMQITPLRNRRVC
jgi:hypothetical protein